MNHFAVLSSEQVLAVHEATLRILSEVGLVITHSEGRALLLDSGCNLKDERVLIPVDLVEKCLRICPNQVTLLGRGKQAACLGGNEIHWHNLGGARDVFLADKSERRPAFVQDIRQW